MPGIAGLISTYPGAASELLLMGDRLSHGASYVDGRYSDADSGVHVTWTTHLGAFNSELPIWNAGRDICLVFIGEDFSDPSSIAALRRLGRKVQAEDPAYLVAMYEEYGEAFVSRLNGCFSGLLIDRRKNRAFLFNDRYGLARIYWRQTDRGLYFSSEAKALLPLFADSRRLDDTAVAELFSVGCVQQGRTLFPGLTLLPPASLWSFHRGGEVDRDTYFRPSEWEGQTPLEEEEFYGTLKETFARILPRYFRGPGRPGMSLTGGLDGRMVMAWIGSTVPDLACYSFVSSLRDCSDVRIARQVAAHCGRVHTSIEVGADYLRRFGDYAARSVYLSDGTMDVSGGVELYVNERAREIAPIRITGNYGSEVLRANIAFRPRRWSADLFEQDFRIRVEEAARTYAIERRVCDETFVAFKQVPWHHYARLSVEQTQLTMRSPFLDNELVALMYRAPVTMHARKDYSLRLIHDGDAELGQIPTDRALVYGRAGVKARIGHLVQEFTAKAEYAYDYGMPHWLALADRVVAPLKLERLFLGRHKFYHFRTWYQHQLAPYVQDVLLDPRTLSRSYIRPELLRGMVLGHVSGRGNYTTEIHRALTMELTQRELLDT